MADVTPSPDASPVARVKPEPISKVVRSTAKGKRVVHRGQSNASENSDDAEELSSVPKVKSEKESARTTVNDDVKEDSDNEPQGRKRLKVANGRPRQSEVRDMNEDDDFDDNETRRATKIFVRDPKDG